MLPLKFLLTISVLLSACCLQAQIADASFKTYLQIIPETGLSFKMVAIPAGDFIMGSSVADKQALPNEQPRRQVTIQAFWMGAYEVTHDEFNWFFEDEALELNSNVDAITRPTPQYIDLTWGMGKTGGYPANSMQQFTALMYCRWLYHKTGLFYRLPTEAEWEYACRAGSGSVYPFGDDAGDLPQYAWFNANSNDAYHKTGALKPNKWGLYDMLGNVAEWTLDQYQEDYLNNLADGAQDPLVVPEKRFPITVRGGSFQDKKEQLRTSSRLASDPAWNRRDPQIPKSRWWLTDAAFVGFRVVRPLQQPTADEIEAFFKRHLGQ